MNVLHETPDFTFKASSKSSLHARFPASVEQRPRPQVPAATGHPPPEIELDFVQQLQNPRKVHQRHSSSHGSRPPSIQESIGGPRTPKSPSSPSFLGFGWFFIYFLVFWGGTKNPIHSIVFDRNVKTFFTLCIL